MNAIQINFVLTLRGHILVSAIPVISRIQRTLFAMVRTKFLLMKTFLLRRCSYNWFPLYLLLQDSKNSTSYPRYVLTEFYCIMINCTVELG